MIDLHKHILTFIVNHWKTGNGAFFKTDKQSNDYKQLTVGLQRLNFSWDASKVDAGIAYLSQAAYIVDPTIKSKGANPTPGGTYEFIPTPLGLDALKPWYLKEWKIVIPIGISLLALAVSIVSLAKPSGNGENCGYAPNKSQPSQSTIAPNLPLPANPK